MVDTTPVSARDFLHATLQTLSKGARESAARSTRLAAVNAGNVQTLANACVRLSSRGGTIVDIVGGADAAGSLSTLSMQAMDSMRAIAETAENAAVLGMECTFLAAGLDTVAILDELNAADGLAIAPDNQSAFGKAMAQAKATAGKSAEVVESMKWLAAAFPHGAESVRSLVLHLQKMRSQNRLVSSDLLVAAEGLETDTRMAFGLLQIAIESTIAADAAARDGEAVWGWITEVATSDQGRRAHS